MSYFLLAFAVKYREIQAPLVSFNDVTIIMVFTSRISRRSMTLFAENRSKNRNEKPEKSSVSPVMLQRISDDYI